MYGNNMPVKILNVAMFKFMSRRTSNVLEEKIICQFKRIFLFVNIVYLRIKYAQYIILLCLQYNSVIM